MKLLYFLANLLVLTGVNCARILVIEHMPTYSHYSLGSSLAIALVNRGHHVTIASPYKQEKPLENLREIVLTGFGNDLEEMRKDFLNGTQSLSMLSLVSQFSKIILDQVITTLENEGIKQLLESDEHFDLIILEKFWEEALLGFVHRFKAPLVYYVPMGASPLINDLVGNPGNPSYIPDIMVGFLHEMTFFERVINLLNTCISNAAQKYYIIPKMDEVMHKYFPDAPPLIDLYYNVSLILLNSHPSYSESVPIVQNMIDIGGYHIKEPKPLPKDLQSYLDNATDGVIYFSMGSHLKSKYVPAEKRDAILKVFSGLKQKVLWKYEDTDLPNKPPNVKIEKWLPQRDLLAHPNVKLFITHGGLLSTIEAVYFGVPILGIPIMGDQNMNAKRSENDGYAISIPYEDLNEESLGLAIEEMVTNPKYREVAKEKSRLFHDRPMKPIDTATYWLEYVIRHRGAPHLRSITTKLKWYQIMLLDVFAFLIAAVYVAIRIIKCVCSLCCRPSVNKKSQKAKND